MTVRLRRRLLLLAAGSLALLGPVGMASAACPRPPPPCSPPAFTGSVGHHEYGCARTGPSCTQSGPRGRRGLTGKTGKTGITGKIGITGRTGAPGAPGPTGSTGDTGAQGLMGVTGDAGVQGLQGLQGLQGFQGVQGLQGLLGLQGLQGFTGDTGIQGLDGVAGDVGATGADGAIGPQGPAGDDGATGATGADGAAGTTGATGPQGAAGSNGLSEYAYIYNTGAATVAREADVPLDSNGVMSPGITHAPGDAAIVLGTTGIYKIAFSVSGVEANQMALSINAAPVSGTVYGSGAGTQQNTGQAILSVAAGDVLRVYNHASASAVTLQTLAGGTETTVNASVVIEKLA